MMEKSSKIGLRVVAGVGHRTKLCTKWLGLKLEVRDF